MAVLPPPPYPYQPGDVAWENYFRSLSELGDAAIPPIDARYVTTTASGPLTNDVNLGLLATGFLFATVAAGVAALSTTNNLPAASLTGILPALNAAALTALTGANITGGGVYTPTLTHVANVAASTAFQCQYSRIGDLVTVSGKVSIDPTAGADTQLGISLPIASNIGADEDLGGVAASPTIAGQCAAILGDASNNRATLRYLAVDVTNQPFAFTFSYRVF
jgi:hypothetical protein